MKHLLLYAIGLSGLASAPLGVAPAPEEMPLPMSGALVVDLAAEFQAPPAPAAPAKVGPVGCAVVRAKVFEEYRKQGKSRLEARRLAAEITDEEINLTVPDAEQISGQKVVGKLGDGTLLKELIAFLQSPQGQALFDALLKLLMGLH